MHTSSGVDAVDEYLETVRSKDGHYSYQYGDGERPIVEKQIIVPYKTAQGMAEKKFAVYYTIMVRSSATRMVVGDHPADAGADQGVDAVLSADQGGELQAIPPDHGAESEFVEQHRLCGCGRAHRLFSRQLHSTPGHAFRLHQAGRGQ